MRYVLAIVSSWYIFIPVGIFFLVGSYVYIHKVEDLYQSEIQLLLKAEETYDYQSALYKGLGAQSSAFATYEHIASQIRVIKSSSILNRVLDKLNLDVSYYITGRLKTSEVFSNLPFLVRSENFDANRVRDFNLKILSQDEFELSYFHAGAEKVIQVSFGELITNDGIYLSVIKNRNLNDISVSTLRKINYSFKLNRREQLLGKYKGALDLHNIEYTSVISISLTDNIPERAKIFLDTLSSVYIQYSQQNKIDVNENTLEYINKQTEEVTDIINEIGSEIEGYKESRSILNITREEDLYFENLIELENTLQELMLKESSIKDLILYVSNLNEEDVNLPPSLIMLQDDVTLVKLLNELYESHLDRLDLIVQVRSENPNYIRLSEQIERLRSEILVYLSETKNFLDKRIVSVKSEIRSTESKIKYIPHDQRELLNIEKRLRVNEELYSFLLSRRAETIIARAAIVPEVKVIEEPRVSGIVYPNRNSFILQWTGIGLFIGLVITFIKIYFFDKIKTLDELAIQTNQTILGMIPILKHDLNYLFNEENTRSRLYESFRSLRANMEFMGLRTNKKIIMVTSLSPGEGKTFTSVNMSYILSRAKKKVLLVDCDLHKPKIKKAFNVEELKGLSSYLTGTEELEQVIYKYDDYLDVLFSGPVPPNASELVASEDFESLILNLKPRYDYIVIDTPPIGLITDALVMMKIADIKLFILNADFTTKRTIKHLEEIIERSNISGSALILNNAKKPFSRYYYGAYRYYYGYGYGYGYGESEDKSS